LERDAPLRLFNCGPQHIVVKCQAAESTRLGRQRGAEGLLKELLATTNQAGFCFLTVGFPTLRAQRPSHRTVRTPLQTSRLGHVYVLGQFLHKKTSFRYLTSTQEVLKLILALLFYHENLTLFIVGLGSFISPGSWLGERR